MFIRIPRHSDRPNSYGNIQYHGDRAKDFWAGIDDIELDRVDDGIGSSEDEGQLRQLADLYGDS